MITLGQLKQLAIQHNLPDDTILCVPINSYSTSDIDIRVNVLNITVKEHSYGKNNVISFITSEKYPVNCATVRTLIDRNTWSEDTISNES